MGAEILRLDEQDKMRISDVHHRTFDISNISEYDPALHHAGYAHLAFNHIVRR